MFQYNFKLNLVRSMAMKQNISITLAIFHVKVSVFLNVLLQEILQQWKLWDIKDEMKSFYMLEHILIEFLSMFTWTSKFSSFKQ